MRGNGDEATKISRDVATHRAQRQEGVVKGRVEVGVLGGCNLGATYGNTIYRSQIYL